MDKVIFGIAETDFLKNINEGINYFPRKIIWLWIKESEKYYFLSVTILFSSCSWFLHLEFDQDTLSRVQMHIHHLDITL